MKVKILAVGRVKEDYLRKKIEELSSKINKKNKIELIEVKDESIPKKAGDAIFREIKKTEGERLMEHIGGLDYVIALCIEGTAANGEKLLGELKKASDRGKESVVFMIGGSLGLDTAITQRADYKMSFSKMTFPHQLMRVMLLEELARLLG